MDQLERVTNLVALLLEARAPMTTEQIEQALADFYPNKAAAFRGAFERDKAVLREIGIPVRQEVLSGANAGRTAYWIDRAAYESVDMDLADDERQALQLAVATTRLSNGSYGMLKLGGDATAATLVNAYVPELDDLPILHDAVARRREVGFGYHGSPRRLRPHGLLLRNSRWYVVGHDLDRDDQRVYRVDRIEGAISVGPAEAFDAPTDFDAAAAFPADPRQLGDGETEQATVRITNNRGALIPGATADGHGSVTVEVPCTNRDAFRAWLFAWGADAEVIAPADVRAEVIAWLDELAGRR